MYDSRLSIKRKLDWSIDIVRLSQFEKRKEYVVITITNQILWNWLIDKLKSMDSRRFNLIDNVVQNYNRIKRRKSDDRQHRDVANFISEGNKIII